MEYDLKFKKSEIKYKYLISLFLLMLMSQQVSNYLNF